MRLDATPAAPSWVTFQLLEHCNLRCRMCYEWGETGAYRLHAQPASLDLDLVLRTVDECAPTTTLFEFFGGEPLLYPGFFDVVARIRGHGRELALPTNGTLLERVAAELVRTAPTRIWVSLDGTREVNDRQRGEGVFEQAMRGIAAIDREKRATGRTLPELGVTCVVTPDTWREVERLFAEAIDLSMLSAVSLEVQSFVTAGDAAGYERVLRERFGVPAAPCARAYVRDPADFASIDADALAASMRAVRERCAARGLRFHSQPRGLDAATLRAYLSGERRGMAEWKPRCAVPWVAAEVSARGEVTTCHTFHDLSIGNLHDAPLLELWRGERARRVREHLREGLLDVCTACCRYYGGAGALPAPRRDG